ncbi:MAG: lipocalin-like domain-containing protein [Chloroflexota bacterium]
MASVCSACARGAAVDPAVLRPPASPAAAASLPPLELPRDDAPHHNLTEWWYYTGHLRSAAGASYGFELVTFQGNRAGTPTAYAAHFAVTDNTRGTFQFAQRTSTAAEPLPAQGFAFNFDGWQMSGFNGHERLRANLGSYGIDLALTSSKPAVLHGQNGIISFGPPGKSYYYSRTRLATSGTVEDHGHSVAVTGSSWMDHQWGNFISTPGGWDWFAIQLNDNSELMLFLLRDAAGRSSGSYGTVVDASGAAHVLPAGGYAVRALGSWTSPQSGVTYPSGWSLTAGGTTLTIEPTVRDQELRTAATTGITYWEGDSTVRGTRNGQAVAGQAYVELVGY